MLQLLIGQIPEALYFALFMIYTKQIKEKRLWFIFDMIVEYILLKAFIHYSVAFHIIYICLMYIDLKFLYRQKSQITDVFTFGIASIVVILISAFCYFVVGLFIKDFSVLGLISRILLFVFIFVFRNKLYKIQKLYKKLWNRNDNIKKKIKSVTFRCINVIAFNLMFYAIYLYIILLYLRK